MEENKALLKVINTTIDAINTYCVKLLELESALCTYNINTTQQKSEEADLLKYNLEQKMAEYKQFIENASGKEYDNKYLQKLAETNPELEIKLNKLRTASNKVKAQLEVVNETNERVIETLNKMVGASESTEPKKIKRKNNKQ